MAFESSSGGPSWGLVLVRVAVGALLLAHGAAAIADGAGAEIVLAARPRIEEAPELYRSFGEGLVLEHPWFFSRVIVLGELVAGVALFLGALTRPAGYLAALVAFGAYFAAAEPERAWVLLVGVACLGCAVSRAGAKAGADVFLDERLPAWMTWTRA